MTFGAPEKVPFCIWWQEKDEKLYKLDSKLISAFIFKSSYHKILVLFSQKYGPQSVHPLIYDRDISFIILDNNTMVRSFGKRNYVKVDAELRSQLIYRAVVAGKSVRKAAKELDINYATAKVIVQKQRQKYYRLAELSRIPMLRFDTYVFAVQKYAYAIPNSDQSQVLKGVAQMVAEIQATYEESVESQML